MDRNCQCRNRKNSGVTIVPHKHIEMPEELKEFIIETVFPKLGHNDRKYLGYWFSTTTHAVLERHDELSHFIHETVFPLLSTGERNYLAQWFTIIHADQFEIGLNGWNALTGTIVESDAHHGTHSLECDGSDKFANYFNFGGIGAETYHKFHVKWSANPGSGEYLDFFNARDFSGDRNLANIGLIESGGTVYWRILYQDGGEFRANATEKTDPAVDTYTCIEIYIKCESGSDDGELQFWVDGTELASVTQTGLNTVSTNIQISRYGNFESDYTVTVHLDCVIIADAGPIGCADTPFLPSVEAPQGTVVPKMMMLLAAEVGN